MNLEQAKKFALECLHKEDLGEFKLSSFDFFPEESNHKVLTYLGEVHYVDEADEVSSVFNVVAHSHGLLQFEWC